ncbi:MAG: hypothetical protein EZS28_001239 [Streblomastix strix]|uniref:Uncharacterized protein n=1 Tax=Streblomastix strix TaxID=222440 RepID=A0A5J4X7S4_9EUKA|nr:MAG: hypothetical protein EZS28_001239 [Streblomastix strix]
MKNGTSIEYFNNEYIMQVKDKIKVYEEGKKAARTLTQAQQTKLLLEATGGGQAKQPKRTLKRHVEQNSDEAEDEAEDYPMNNDDDEQDEQQIIVENPRQIPKPKPMKTIKKPQINYTSPQVDLEELILLRTENSFINYYCSLVSIVNQKIFGLGILQPHCIWQPPSLSWHVRSEALRIGSEKEGG